MKKGKICKAIIPYDVKFEQGIEKIGVLEFNYFLNKAKKYLGVHTLDGEHLEIKRGDGIIIWKY